MLATDQFAEPYRVLPVRAAGKRETIEKARAKISELEKLADEVFARVAGSGSKPAAFWDPLARKALEEEISKYDNLTRDAVTILNDYAISVSKEWGRFTSLMKFRFTLAILLISITLCFTLALAAVFGVVMSHSFEKHLNDIIGQIKALSSGELDLTKKIDQTSKDELGVLSKELNKLMDTIGNMTNFKKVIEGDESIEDIYLRLGKIFKDELGIDDCVIYEISDSKKAMEIVYPPGARGLEMHCRMDVQLDCELCRAKRTGLLVSSRDFSTVCKYYNGGEGVGHLCIPIITGGNIGGIVQLVCTEMDHCDKAILERKTAKARQYVREAQPVLEAKRLMKTLKESSLRDGLTGLYNRRFLEECSETLVAGVQRRHTALGLLMCDLDFFKETNDIYGHDVGDMVLKETSSVIRKSVRASDVVVRFGGEEFLVLLTDADPQGIVASAEKIRAAIEETQVKVAGGFVKKTISIGASEFPADTQNFWEAIKYADVALYKAKDSGRNRVMRFSSEMWTQERY
jgi:diguanylate cyclase (GGDEF)-like protein